MAGCAETGADSGAEGSVEEEFVEHWWLNNVDHEDSADPSWPSPIQRKACAERVCRAVREDRGAHLYLDQLDMRVICRATCRQLASSSCVEDWLGAAEATNHDADDEFEDNSNIFVRADSDVSDEDTIMSFLAALNDDPATPEAALRTLTPSQHSTSTSLTIFTTRP